MAQWIDVARIEALPDTTRRYTSVGDIPDFPYHTFSDLQSAIRTDCAWISFNQARLQIPLVSINYVFCNSPWLVLAGVALTAFAFSRDWRWLLVIPTSMFGVMFGTLVLGCVSLFIPALVFAVFSALALHVHGMHDEDLALLAAGSAPVAAAAFGSMRVSFVYESLLSPMMKSERVFLYLFEHRVVTLDTRPNLYTDENVEVAAEEDAKL